MTESEVKSAFKSALGVGRTSAAVFVGVERREADRVRRFTRVRCARQDAERKLMDSPGYQDGKNSERAEGTGGGGGNCRKFRHSRGLVLTSIGMPNRLSVK